MTRLAEMFSVVALLLAQALSGCAPTSGSVATQAVRAPATAAVAVERPVEPPLVHVVTVEKPPFPAEEDVAPRHDAPALSAADRVLELLLRELELKRRLDNETDPARRLELMSELNRCRDARDDIYAADGPEDRHDE